MVEKKSEAIIVGLYRNYVGIVKRKMGATIVCLLM